MEIGIKLMIKLWDRQEWIELAINLNMFIFYSINASNDIDNENDEFIKLFYS